MAYKFITTKQRSNLMKKIKSNNTTPEIILRRKLWGNGFRFGRNGSKLPGKPDIVMNKYKVAIFIDGEFWHGYQWYKKKKRLKSNKAYWIPKIERNILRDRKNNRKLRRGGWKVIRFWQHQITKDLTKCLKKVEKTKRMV